MPPRRGCRLEVSFEISIRTYVGVTPQPRRGHRFGDSAQHLHTILRDHAADAGRQIGEIVWT
jgi:hypothetical protein